MNIDSGAIGEYGGGGSVTARGRYVSGTSLHPLLKRGITAVAIVHRKTSTNSISILPLCRRRQFHTMAYFDGCEPAT